MALLRANYPIFSVHMPQDSLCRLSRQHFRIFFPSPADLRARVQAPTRVLEVLGFRGAVLKRNVVFGGVKGSNTPLALGPSGVSLRLKDLISFRVSGICSSPRLYSVFQALFFVGRRRLTRSVQNLLFLFLLRYQCLLQFPNQIYDYPYVTFLVFVSAFP